jgi:hypothetical protein
MGGGAFVIGGKLVSPEELDEKLALGFIPRLRERSVSGRPAEIRFRAGAVSAADLAAEVNRPDFAPIGIGKPLGIEILTVYTGNAPGHVLGVLTGEPSLLVTSGARGAQTIKEAPRAINQLVERITDRQHLEPDAFAEGSPVVYYSRAETNRTTLTSYELVVESFDHKLFESIASLFATAGGLPIFAPAGAYLLAGSVVMKMFAKLGKALLESDPFLRSRFTIRFETPALEVTQPRQIVLFNEASEIELRSYVVRPVKLHSGQEQARLVESASGHEYRGDAPYVIASLDGRLCDDLNDFAPKHASAELLDDFYRSEGAPSKVIEVMGEALQLYSDLSFREKAEQLATEIKNLEPNSKERADAEKMLQAYKDNIRNDLLRLA